MQRREIFRIDEGEALQSALAALALERQGLHALEQALRHDPSGELEHFPKSGNRFWDKRCGENKKPEQASDSTKAHSDLAVAFCAAVRQIAATTGRVVVTGLGKSGHIGGKIAATLASTGTAAFFVHAAEANHGDLGMIGRHDAILALSWSGETVELKGILDHSRRFNIPLIALTSREDSALGRIADIVLLLPKVEEACPHGLAPTTSTIMQLALGDALAMALLKVRRFSASDFKIFHPGGSLGASLSFVRDLMHGADNLPLVPLGTLMPHAMQVLAAKHFGCVGVIDELGKLIGIVTDGDLARNATRDLSNLRVDDIMTKSPKTVSPDMMAAAAMALIHEFQISALLVTKGEKPVGILHFHDLLRIGAV